MVNPLLKRVPRTIRANRWLVYGSITLVALACMLYVTLNALQVDIGYNRARFEQESRIEAATFLPRTPFADVAAFEKREGLIVETRREVDLDAGEGLTLRVFEESTRVNIPALMAGRALANDTELLLGDTAATARKIRLDSTVLLGGRTFTVVGFVAVPDYMYPIQTTDDAGIMLDPAAFGIAVVTPDAMDDLAPAALRTWHVRSPTGSADGARQAIAAAVGLTYWQDIAANPRYTLATAKLEGAASVSTTMPLVILLMTSLLLAAGLGRMIQLQRSQLGMLKALGYSTRQLVLQELALPALIAVAGALVGVVVSIVTARPLMSYMGSYFSIPLYSAAIPAQAILVGTLTPVLFIVPVTAFVALRLLRQTPVRLMQTNTASSRIGWLERSVHLAHGSFRRRFTVRTAVRGITRLTLLLLGALLAGYLLLFGGAMRDSMNELMRSAFQGSAYSYTYALTAPQTENLWGGEPVTVIPFATSDGALTFQVLGLPPVSPLLTLYDATGASIPVDRVIVTRALAEKLSLKIGDDWSVRQTTGAIDVSMRVDAIAEVYATAAVFMPQDRLNTMAGLPVGSFNSILSDTKLAIPARDVLTVLSQDDSRAAFESAIEPLWVALGFVAVMGVFIALMALSVVTTLAVEEERVSLSLLKVLGYHSHELSQMVLGSGIIVVALGFALSIPLLLSSVERLYTRTTASISFSLPIRLSPVSVIVCFALMVLTYLVSLRSARRKVAGVSMAVSLKAARE